MYKLTGTIIINFFWVLGPSLWRQEFPCFWAKSFLLQDSGSSFIKKRIMAPALERCHEEKAEECIIRRASTWLVWSKQMVALIIKKNLACKLEDRNAFSELSVISRRSSQRGENEENEEKYILFIKCLSLVWRSLEHFGLAILFLFWVHLALSSQSLF